MGEQHKLAPVFSYPIIAGHFTEMISLRRVKRRSQYPPE
uniref:Uncharacterized protein n=1 Tax=Yersinia ruckeri TaxID=29486 RepID=A0A0A8VJQ8_YERRU|nr:hypothetical protein CSF007_12275 [Yersinia ruckeri]